MRNFTSAGQSSHFQKEHFCENTFLNGGPFWHICTDGQATEILFESEADYKFAVTLLAVCSAVTGVVILAFELMSNHIHLIVSGDKKACEAFFDMFKKRLSRYYATGGRYVSMVNFLSDPIPVESLSMLRTEIVYTHRNGYLVNDSYTPFLYPWGSGCLYFSRLNLPSGYCMYKDLSVREKRLICRSRVEQLPESFMVADGMILPQSFVNYRYGMSFFRDAHQYFSLVSKNYEAFSAVAKRLGDRVVLTDDEMIAVVRQLSKKMFSEDKAVMLPAQAKIELAKLMKRDYNSSEGQIQRMLRLDRGLVAELFGRRTTSVHK